MTGIVTNVLRNKGIAFLRDEEGFSRLARAKEFVPQISFDTVIEGNVVEFTPTEGGRGGNGLRAENVKVRKTT